jgi:hypothetical protein
MSKNADGSNSADRSNSAEARRPAVPGWPLLAIGFGGAVAFLVAAWVGGHPWLGLGAAALMVFGTAVAGLVSRRSETVRGLIDHRDERLAGIDLLASATAGHVLIVAVIIGALVELGRGHSGTPYTWLGGLAGIAYLARVVFERVRH